MDKQATRQVFFKRKNDYSDITITNVRKIIETSNELNLPILAVPSSQNIILYYGGLPFAFINDRQFRRFGKDYFKYFDEQTLLTSSEDYKSFLMSNRINLQTVLKGIYNGLSNDYERHTQHFIAVNNLSFDDNAFSVCGIETAIPSRYFINIKTKPEIDMVTFCPNKKKMLLIEYKCRNSSLIGNCGVVEHGKAYTQVLQQQSEIRFIEEMLKAYNVLRKIYNKPLCNLKAEEVSLEMLFLTTGSTIRNNQKSNISYNRCLSAMKSLYLSFDLFSDIKNKIFWQYSNRYENIVIDEKNFKTFKEIE